jgi:hypothetical protein
MTAAGKTGYRALPGAAGRSTFRLQTLRSLGVDRRHLLSSVEA